MKNIVQITSGLGNQMFQYAFGLAVKAKFDVSWFDGPIGPTSIHRKYELPLFKCDVPIITNSEVMKLVRRPKILRILGLKPKFETLREPTPSTFHPEYINRDFTNFVGYFQCEKYFLHMRDRLLSEFQIRNPPSKLLAIKSITNGCNSVSLHIRRGDYVQFSDTMGLCSIDYYRSAMSFLRKKTKTPKFFIFSDDIEWAKSAFANETDCVFISEPWENSLCDISLMSTCRHNIIANSTYSWWGAWLNQNPEKIVIAPSKWLATGQHTDIVPDSWIQM